MEQALRRAAAARVLRDEEGNLKARISPGELLDLWLPHDGTQQTKRKRIELQRLIRNAIQAGALTVAEETTTQQVPMPFRGFRRRRSIWGDDDTASFFGSSARVVAPAPAPSSRAVTREWIARENLQTWLANIGAPPSPESALREWWPDEVWDAKPKQLAERVASEAQRLGSQEAALEFVSAWLSVPYPGLKKAFFERKGLAAASKKSTQNRQKAR